MIWRFVLILILASILRLSWLDRYPAGFSADEASFGYNAYSLLKTGRDEWGDPWYHIIYANLRSFGDARFPLYTFLTIPSVKIFGLTEFAVRLPNAVIGIFAVAAVYLMASKLFPHSQELAAVLMAISPWHISLSRGAFETNSLTIFVPLGIYLLLNKRFLWAAVILSLNTYSYIAARVLTLPVAFTIMWYKKTSIQNWLKFTMLFVIIAGPGLLFMFKSGNSRVADVGIFSPTDNWHEVATRRFEARNAGFPDSLSRMFSNKVIYLISNFKNNYFSYFSPQFLFTSGAGEATYGMIPGRGTLYLIEVIFLLSFFISYIKTPSLNKGLLILLLFLSPIPAALSKGGGFAANRVASMIPILIVMSAVGIKYFFSSFHKYSKLIVTSIFILYGSLLLFFIEDYLYHAPKNNARSMNYGWTDLMPRLMPIATRFKDVRFSRSLSEPHIFVAFYNKIDPAEYQRESLAWLEFEKKGLKFLDQYDGYTLGKYRFGDLKYPDKVTRPTLFIGRPDEFPSDVSNYIKVYYPNGTPAMLVVEKQP